MQEFRFRTKFIALLLVVSLVPTILIGFLSYEISKSSLHDQIKLDLRVQAENLMGQIDRFLYERYNDAQYLISDSTLISSETPVEEKSKILREYKTNLGLYDGIHLLDLEGNTIATTQTKIPEMNMSEESWFSNTKKLFYNSSDLTVSPFTKNPTILFSNVVFDENKSPTGVVVIEMTWPVILEFLNDLPDTTEAILLNQNNIEIGGGDTINILSKDWSTSAKNDFETDDYLTALTTSKGYLVYKGNFWNLVLRTPTDIALAPLNRLFQLLALMLIVVVVAIILAGIVFGQRFVDPIRRLTIGAQKIAKGDLNQKIKVESGDEIGFLAKTFNQMAVSLKKKQAKLQKSLKKEQELKRTKDEIWDTASHKLRTPLTGMRWALEMLESKEQGSLNDKQQGMVNGLVKNVTRLNSLINVLLTAAKLDKGTIPLQRQEVYLEEIIKNAIKLKEVEIRERQIRMKTPNLDKNKTKLFLDSNKTQQVFNMFIDNAIAYNKAKGKVIIDIKRGKENVICSISDNGIGMTKKEKRTVFQKFVRGDDAARYDTEGIGLSLYIAKIIIDSSNGKLWFESEKGKGTIFYIEFPLA